MRSDDPLIAPVRQRQPRRKMSFVGNLLMTLGPKEPPPTPGYRAPRIAVTPEYGAYLANDVLHCILCHTPGYTTAGAKIGKPGMYGGGFELKIIGGRKVTSANITFDSTGIAGWSEAGYPLAK